MSSNFTANTQHALASAKNVNASDMKLEGPETWDQWYQTIRNICMDTKTGATSGVFRTLSVWDAIMSEERRDEEQHQPSQRFLQQLIMACISSENYDIIKSIPEKDPNNEDNASYNRARLQLQALEKDRASSSTATLRVLIDEQRTMKIDDFKKPGVKDSRAVTLFFQAHNNIVHRINKITEHRQNEQDLLYSVMGNLPDRFKAAARRAVSIEDLKTLLIQESHLYLDTIDTQEQVFVAAEDAKTDKKFKSICFSWSNNGHCRFGDKCRFEHDQSIFAQQPNRQSPYPHRGFSTSRRGRGGYRGRGGPNRRSDFTTSAGRSVHFHDSPAPTRGDFAAPAGRGANLRDDFTTSTGHRVHLHDQPRWVGERVQAPEAHSVEGDMFMSPARDDYDY